ncbi:MAG: hypothetical protein CVT92_03360 [Bacteroidetes bacterium HGW-Bacteroidetes-1]|jgi:hypothetical protein|nr:MAG: hypothetical protein CVT92_03360 [Bacteroidetes bacterium HGW-Bacteroidetes-1]
MSLGVQANLQRFGINAYFIALVLLAVSIPLSKFVMSISQFMLIFIWLSDGISRDSFRKNFRALSPMKAVLRSLGYVFTCFYRNLVHKTSLFLNNRVAVVMASLFLLHVVGLVHTTDFDYALKDLRTKIPLLILPMIMSSMPALNRKQASLLLIFFVLSVFAGTMFSLNEFLRKEFLDIRQISVFISSVRFSLTIVFSFFILMAFLFSNEEKKTAIKIAIFCIMVWFVVFLTILESAIGLISLVIILSGLLLSKAFVIKNGILRTFMVVLFIGIPSFTFWYVSDVIIDLSKASPIDIKNLDSHTLNGNPYRHDTIHFGVEDGKYVGLYFAEEEMARAWNNRSGIDFYGRDKAGQLIMYTVIRYLTSRDLRKDSIGVYSLSGKDIQLIEKGVANINYMENPSIRTRLSKILMGYRQFADLNDPNGSSVMQRIEYMRASLLIIKENFWTGVGTGDLPQIFKETYERIDTPLKNQWRWRSHNQYLSIFIAFGFFGFLWFMFTLIFPLIDSKKYNYQLYVVFLAIMLLSMLTEDTIESQDGVTLFAFFNTFFLVGCRKTINDDL